MYLWFLAAINLGGSLDGDIISQVDCSFYNLKVMCIDSQSGQNIRMWLNFHTFHRLKALWLVVEHYAVCTFHLSMLLTMDCIRGLLEMYPTFGREKETGLLGALDT